MGVREATLILVLSPSIGDETALVFALTMRMVTVIADTLIYLGGLIIEFYLDRVRGGGITPGR